MIDLSNVKHHPCIDELVELLCNKTQNMDKGFFKVEVAYFLAKMAACMRASVITKDRGEIPINLYVIDLANSGLGKGYSVNIMESSLINGFKRRFVEETMPTIAEQNLWNMANDRAVRNATEPKDEFDKLNAEYRRLGAYPFTFDSGTSPAIKQLRQRLLLASCGSINLQIDEIGSNLIGSTEILNTYLELYDQGLTKMKLVKNTADNIRGEDLDGKTPANMLLFGTPVKLFDGGQTEDQFYSFLEIGYARRCLFGIGHNEKKSYYVKTVEQIFQDLTQPKNDQIIKKWSDKFSDLADPAMFNWKMDMDDTVAIKLLEYKINCEKAADLLPEYEEVRKAELSHRYFKALKLAGALAFIDQSLQIDMDHLLQAILLVEESGEAFKSILTREKSYMKLAKYIANIGTEVTHADLTEALPFYKTSSTARNEMMTLATAWGYKQHILIKKTFRDNIEFFQGETLKKTDLNEMIISYSDHYAYNYLGERVPFDQLHVLTQQDGFHWCNHHFKNGHRADENVIPGFNLIVLDVDGDISLKTAQELLKEYKYLMYTTKRHTEEENRFRIIIPTNYELELDTEDYREFMNNLFSWIPFKVDEASNQRAKKWESCSKGQYFYNLEGKVLDILPFIPRTTKNEQYQKDFQKIESMDNLERWFAQRISTGNRNNQMIKYALALVDNGLSYQEVENHVKGFNSKLSNPLPETELQSTILVTVAKKYA